MRYTVFWTKSDSMQSYSAIRTSRHRIFTYFDRFRSRTRISEVFFSCQFDSSCIKLNRSYELHSRDRFSLFCNSSSSSQHPGVFNRITPNAGDQLDENVSSNKIQFETKNRGIKIFNRFSNVCLYLRACTFVTIVKR